MATINTYSALIERAINDFDTIFDALADKGVESNKKPLIKDTETLEGGIKKSGGLETSAYAGLIKDELWKIEGLVGDPTETGEKLIANFSTSTLALNEKSSVISGNTLTLTLDGLQKGYYATGTTLTYTKALNSIQISGTPTAAAIGGTGLSFDDTDKDYYKLVATTLPIASVNIKKGSASGSIAQDDISATVTLDTAVTKAESGSTIANYTINPTEAGTNVSKIKLSVVPSYTASVTAQAKLTLSAGYITSVANPEAVTKEIAKSNGTASDVVIEVPNAVVNDVEVSGTIAATVPADLKYTHTEDDGAYKIDLAGTLSATDISGTAGYLADPSSIKFKASNAIESNEVYIKKGSIGTAATNAHALTSLTTGAGKYVNSKYTVPVSVSETLSKDVTPGYITATKFESELSGSTNVEIAGAVGAGVSATKSDLKKSADSSSIFTEADVDGAYKITLTGSVSYEKTLTTAGYLNSVAQISAPATTEFSKTLSVAKGAVSSSATLAVTFVEKDGKHETLKPFEGIFLDTAPTGNKDYYTVTATPAASVSTVGYVTASDVSNGAAAVKYIPKATFKFVKIEDTTGGNAKNFIEVDQGGYIPSGVIENLTDFTNPDEIDYAVVPVVAAFNETTLKVTISKGAVNPGYISSANGALSNNVIDISKITGLGSAVLTPTAANITLSTTATKTAEGKYKFTGSGNSTVDVAATKGYIKGINDVSMAKVAGSTFASGTLTTENSAVLELNEGTFETASDSVVNVVAGTGSNVSLGTAESAYYVVPKVNGKVAITVNQAGYISTEMADKKVSIKNSTSDKIYITPGTKLTTVAGSASEADVKLTLDKTGGYFVKLAAIEIPVSGTLSAGYYGTTEADVSGTASVAAKSLEIAAAQASVEGKISATLTSDNTSILQSEKPEGTSIAITTSSSMAGVVAKVGKEGYLDKAAQITTSVSGAEASVTKYIAVNSKTSFAVTPGSENISSGGNDANIVAASGGTITCANTVNTSNITISVSEHAMGSSVADELTRLSKRLAGILEA